MAQVPRQRRKILSEEEYTTTLSSIVQRDYFPDLPDLERQAAVLDRRAQGDFAGAVAVRRAARRLQEHEEGLAAQEEEDEQDLNDGEVRRRARPLHQETITGFHARATNEDDDEFDSNQKREVQANRKRLESLFQKKDANDSLPLLTSGLASDQFEPSTNGIASTTFQPPAIQNGLFFNPTPLRGASEPEPTSKSMKAITNGHVGANPEKKSSALALMPPPAKPSQSSRSQQLALPKNQLIEYIPKARLEKRIQPSQTRFPSQQLRIIPQPGAVRGPLSSTASDWSETDGSITDASTDLDAPFRPVEQERRRRLQQERRQQESYVSMTPLLVPGTGNESPITTWGTIDSTPLVLSGQEEDESTTRRSTFSLPGENNRDRAARKAEDELARRAKRAKTPKRVKTKRPGSLTPAAAALFARTQRTPSRTKDAFASALRSSYTPKVKSKVGSASSRRRNDTAYKATPLASKR